MAKEQILGHEHILYRQARNTRRRTSALIIKIILAIIGAAINIQFKNVILYF